MTDTQQHPPAQEPSLPPGADALAQAWNDGWNDAIRASASALRSAQQRAEAAEALLREVHATLLALHGSSDSEMRDGDLARDVAERLLPRIAAALSQEPTP